MTEEVKRILVVDDEEDLCEILQYNLINEGFYTEIAHSAEEAINRPLSTFDLILLDVMMGPMSGFKFADKIRNELKLSNSIIFLSAKNTENDMLTGFSLGADDYISKPFSINELMARIKAVLRRSAKKNKNHDPVIRQGDMELNTNKRNLIINDEQEELSRKECDIMKLFLENQGKVFSRKEIINKVWRNSTTIKDRNVDVNITRLRTKLGKYGPCIKNKTGFGYYLEF